MIIAETPPLLLPAAAVRIRAVSDGVSVSMTDDGARVLTIVRADQVVATHLLSPAEAIHIGRLLIGGADVEG